jgi:hypothetical protein
MRILKDAYLIYTNFPGESSAKKIVHDYDLINSRGSLLLLVDEYIYLPPSTE